MLEIGATECNALIEGVRLNVAPVLTPTDSAFVGLLGQSATTLKNIQPATVLLSS